MIVEMNVNEAMLLHNMIKTRIGDKAEEGTIGTFLAWLRSGFITRPHYDD